ncbi:hypothetical protein BH23CHL8_BH23CHL8_26570 [soil metagenome]
MTGRRAKDSLLAKLTPDRMSVSCGRCGGPIAYVAMARHEFRDGSGWGEPFRVLRFVAGWRPDAKGVWILSYRAQRRLQRGQSPHLGSGPGGRRRERGEQYVEGMKGAYPIEPARLPVRARCPGCEAEQVLDPLTLDVDPEGSVGLPVGRFHIISTEVAPLRPI